MKAADEALRFEPGVRVPGEASTLAFSFAFVGGQLLLPEADAAALPPLPPAALAEHASVRHFLGRIDGHDCWALRLDAAPAGWRAVALRAAMMQFPGALMGAASRAAQVLEWDRAHRFCGVCGTPTEAQAHELARKCPACGHSAYPRLSPAMMVLIWRGRELLLARSPHYAPGMFSALAGFVEPGESLEDCIHREVGEEVGVTVRDLRYYGSQSWPFPHSLMVAYTAKWVEGEIVPQAGEIEDARWYPLAALPKIPPRFSISGHLIRDTVRTLGGPEPSATATPVVR
jgi:NAD+ diphosphatase